MKLLSVAVPCYNSQDYMEHCVETLVSGGEEVEVIIVNDGSKDGTHDLAVKLSEKYPSSPFSLAIVALVLFFCL